jgi:uncharacterized protein (TIGR04141 family)
MNGFKSIYKIDTKNRDLKALRDTKAIINRIIRTSIDKTGGEQPQVIDTTNYKREAFTYHLYLTNTEEQESEWAEFIPEDLKDETSFVQQKISLLLFIETDLGLFVIPGGSAYRFILPFIDTSFGLTTYDRIIEIADDELTSMKSRGITGQRIAANEQYRDNYKLINYIKFGKVPQELTIKLSEKSSLSWFSSLQKKVSERIYITVGKGFQVRKQIDFDNLHHIIKEICWMLAEVPKDYLSSYIEITDDSYKHDLREALHQKIYDYIPYLLGTDLDSRNKFEYDFCNPNQIERFYQASKHVLKEKDGESYRQFDEVEDRSAIFPTVVRYAYAKYGNNAFEIKVFLNGVRILSYTEATNPLTSSFMFYLSAEITYQNHPIFLIDTKWYQLKELFVKDMTSQAQRILKAFPLPAHILHVPWDKTLISKEGQYNLKYDGLPGYIVADTVIVDGVEICDIIHYDDDNVYLIHVKYGFDARIRDLTNQILISARRLNETKSSGDNKFLEKVFQQISGLGRDMQGLDKTGFIDLFSKNIIYVLAMTSQLKNDLKIEEHIEKYSSNIARFSLITCSTDVRGFYEMLTYQIPRI